MCWIFHPWSYRWSPLRHSMMMLLWARWSMRFKAIGCHRAIGLGDSTDWFFGATICRKPRSFGLCYEKRGLSWLVWSKACTEPLWPLRLQAPFVSFGLRPQSGLLTCAVYGQFSALVLTQVWLTILSGYLHGYFELLWYTFMVCACQHVSMTRVVFLAAPGGLMVMGIDMSKGKEVKVKCGIPGETFFFLRLLDSRSLWLRLVHAASDTPQSPGPITGCSASSWKRTEQVCFCITS